MTTADSGNAESDRIEPAGPGDQLSRAAAQGPLNWDDAEADHPGAGNEEPGELHDSPAAVDEDRLGRRDDEELDTADSSMSTIYGPPADGRRERSGE